MWHKLSFVAESRNLDPEVFKHYALTWKEKYSIVDEGTGPEVNTWNVDTLVADYKAWHEWADKTGENYWEDFRNRVGAMMLNQETLDKFLRGEIPKKGK